MDCAMIVNGAKEIGYLVNNLQERTSANLQSDSGFLKKIQGTMARFEENMLDRLYGTGFGEIRKKYIENLNLVLQLLLKPYLHEELAFRQPG